MTLPFDSAIRAAVYSRLTQDPILQGFLGGAPNALKRILHRPKRDDLVAPTLSYSEALQRGDLDVPLFDVTIQVDHWSMASRGHGLDEATAMADRTVALIDFDESGKAGLAPFAIPDDVGRIDYCQQQSSMDLPREDGELVVVPKVFRLLVYQF